MHFEHEPGLKKLKFAVLTISTSRYLSKVKEERYSDASYSIAKDLIGGAGHRVVLYKLVPDDPAEIIIALTRALEASPDVILTIGGTGPAPDDVTVEVIEPLFRKKLRGFSELFRAVSYSEVGGRAMLSNATAGIIGHTIVFCLPGSPSGVKLALKDVIIPIIQHLHQLAVRDLNETS